MIARPTVNAVGPQRMTDRTNAETPPDTAVEKRSGKVRSDVWESLDSLADATPNGSAERAALLDEVRAVNPELCTRIEKLFENYTAALSFFRGFVDALDDRGQDEFGSARTFSVGQLVAGRFRIVAFLGRGGMGEVYEAEDLVLRGQHVALKTVLPLISLNDNALASLKNEIAIARRVTHPNVCRVFEIDQHDTPSGGTVWFFTMELLKGETLGQRLQNRGRLTTAEALPIVENMVAALSAAHSAEVVHGDLKPGNVLLVSSTVEKERAVVTDFGLARWAPAGAPLLQTTIGHAGWGTPTYMAPELFEGEKVSYASDVYALGAVIYEMVTGKRPFEGESPFQVALKKVRSTPRPPRHYGVDLDSRWDAVILRCLNIDPKTRFQAVAEVGEALGRGVHKPAVKWVPYAAAALLVLPSVVAKPAVLSVTKTIAVTPFADASQTPDAEAFRHGLSAAVADQLGLVFPFDTRIRVIPFEEVVGAGIKTASVPQNVLGAGMVVGGEIRRESDGTHITITLNDVAQEQAKLISRRIFDVPKGEPVIETTLNGVVTMANLSLPAAARRALTSGLTAEVLAEEWYLRGRGYLEGGPAGVERAIEAFEQAIKLDHAYALAYSALAEAYLQKYESTRDPAFVALAQSNSGEAIRLEPSLPRLHVIRGRLYSITAQHQRAISELQEALRLNADSVDARLALALVHEREGSLQAAEAAFRESVARHPDYWSVYGTFGAFLYRHGRYAQAETSFVNALQRAPENVVMIRNLVGLYILTERFAAAEAESRKGLTVQPDATLYNNLGWVYVYQSQYKNAVDTLEQATRLPGADSRIWGNLARAYRWDGRAAQARVVYETAIRIARAEVAVNPRYPAIRANLALLWAETGNGPEALAEIAGALERSQTDVTVLFSSAVVHELLGDRESALEALEAAAKGGHSIVDIRRHPDLRRMREEPRYQRLLALAARSDISR